MPKLHESSQNAQPLFDLFLEASHKGYFLSNAEFYVTFVVIRFMNSLTCEETNIWLNLWAVCLGKIQCSGCRTHGGCQYRISDVQCRDILGMINAGCHRA